MNNLGEEMGKVCEQSFHWKEVQIADFNLSLCMKKVCVLSMGCRTRSHLQPLTPSLAGLPIKTSAVVTESTLGLLMIF